MKGCVAAALLLAVMVVGVGLNAAYIRNAGEETIKKLDELPAELSVTDSDEAQGEAAQDPTAAIVDLRERFEKRARLLRITVGAKKLTEIRQALLLLEGYARAGAQEEYAVTRRLLRGLLENLARSEDLTPQNLL